VCVYIYMYICIYILVNAHEFIETLPDKYDTQDFVCVICVHVYIYMYIYIVVVNAHEFIETSLDKYDTQVCMRVSYVCV
jgi:hypothetical protein